MRSFLLATTFGAAQSLAVTNKSKKPAVQALMESATTMLKNGATPEVVTFAQYTLDEVTGTVMPAIIAESENDQTFINNLFARFAVITSELIQGNTEIDALNAEETDLSSAHMACRNAEHLKCYGDGEFEVPAIETCSTVHDLGHHHLGGVQSSYGEGKRPCEMELYNLWEAWVDAEEDLRIYHDHIHGHFCPEDANGTTKVFRVSASEWMHTYCVKKDIVDTKLVIYDHKALCCEVAHGALDEKSLQCNALQDQLEEKACEHASKIHTVLNNYYRDYAQAESAYNCAEEEVRQLESDRKKEWITLEVVRCLLDRIEEQNGVPCDESTGTVTDAVGVCEERHAVNICEVQDAQIVSHSESWTAADVRKICINYPVVPPHPDFCHDRHSVAAGQLGATHMACRPEPIPTPCVDEQAVNGQPAFRWTHYDGLPAVPEATFSSTNPGCNAYPACTPCPQPPTPQPFQVDTCPGYTVDGCERDGVDDEHPLTFIRSVNGLADVRCCSTVSSDLECKSQDFAGGVDFTTPSGGTHTSCYFDVTYQTALEVCHVAGMRICTVAEMDTCCGTGCWHNHHAIWVDTQGTGAAVYQTEEQHVEHREATAAGQEWRSQLDVPEPELEPEPQLD